MTMRLQPRRPALGARVRDERDGVMVSEFQLTERDLADPPAFVAAIKQSIEQVEDEEP